jgi:hypothetical protein
MGKVTPFIEAVEAADEALLKRLDDECYPLGRQISMVDTRDLRAFIAEHRLAYELLRRAAQSEPKIG